VQTCHGAGCEKVTGYTSEEFAARQTLWLDIVVRGRQRSWNSRMPSTTEAHLPSSTGCHKNGAIQWVRNTVISRPAPTGRGFLWHDGTHFSDVPIASGLRYNCSSAKDGSHGQLAGRRSSRLQQHAGVYPRVCRNGYRTVDPASSLHGDLVNISMPEMNGVTGQQLLVAPSPSQVSVHVWFNCPTLARQGVLEEGVSFIQKPFSAKDVAAIVRKVLDSDPSAA